MKITNILLIIVLGFGQILFSQEIKVNTNRVTKPTTTQQLSPVVDNISITPTPVTSTSEPLSIKPLEVEVQKTDSLILPSPKNDLDIEENESDEIQVKDKSKKGKTSLYGKKGKQFKDMSVQLFLGQPFLAATAVRSVAKYDLFKVYDVQLAYTYNFSHTFGLQLVGQIGKTRGHYQDIEYLVSETNYSSLFLLGDINISSMFRRSDYKPSNYYKWAMHAYGGMGTIAYETDGIINETSGILEAGEPFEAKLFRSSWAAQVAVGLRRRINQSFDVELKQSWVYTNDKTFDGAGPTLTNQQKNNNFTSGNFFTTALGVHYKIGKKKTEHLGWVDPLQKTKSDVIKSIVTGKGLEDYKGINGMQGASGFNGINGVNGINTSGSDGKVCTKDADDDGVCDEWDRELTTPVGARVDGSGVALDVDKDTVIDLFDQCVVVPGEGNPTGCPEKQTVNTEILISKLSSINLALEGIDFDFNSAIIKPQYFTLLDQAGFVMNEFPSYKFYVQGHTDAKGSDYYNYVLSKKRAESVKTYLMDKQGVASDRIVVDPKGETELKNPECQPDTKCDEAKNRENRRIVFVPIE